MIHRSTSPRTPIGSAELGRAEDPNHAESTAGARAQFRVLFVDDDPLAEMALRRAFERLGIETPITVAHDGLEALDVLRDPWFSLERCVLLIDLNMPRMDGHELLRELKADSTLAHLPVVVMSTSDDPRDVELAYEAGAAGYFVKPSSFADLVERVRMFMAYWSTALLARPKGRSGAYSTIA